MNMVDAPTRVELNRRPAPSGVQTGNQSVPGSKVIRAEMPRATSRTQISEAAWSSRTDIATLFWDAGAWGLRTDAAGNPLASARPRYKAGAATLTMDGSARIPPFKGLSAEERVNLYQSATFRPNFFLNVHPDYVNSHQMLATGPESVRMIYDWLFEPDNMPRSEADLEHYVALWDLTNRQDARNCEWQQEGLHARPLAHGNFVPQEHGCHQFNQWVLESLGEREPSPSSGRNGGMTGMA